MQSSDLKELNEWAPRMLAKMQALPELRDVASDQQTEGTTLTLTINRDQASRYGLTAQAIDDTLYDASASVRSPNTLRSSRVMRSSWKSCRPCKAMLRHSIRYS